MRSLFGGLAAALTNKAPVPYTSRSSRWAMPWRGRNDAEAQMRAMGSVGTLFSIVHRTSNATSQVEWHLWRKAKSGRKEDRVEVTSHAALDLWNRPNPWMPRQEFVEVEQQHVDLTGEGWWVIAYHPAVRIPLELWPVRPDRIYPVPDPQEFIRGYVYVSPDGEQIPLERHEVICLRMPNPLDPYRGMGPVQSILSDLDAVKYSAEWNRNFFINSAMPGGIIEAPEYLDDERFNELRERWDEQHRGVAAAHRVAILEGGLKWVDRKFSMRDMQFVELRDVGRDVLREAFGMPKFALGDVDDVNRATAEASKAWFAEQLTVPRLERFKAALNFDLLPLYGDTARDLEWDYEDPVPANREADNEERTSKASAASTLVTAGWEPAAVLSAVGLPEMPYVGRAPAPVEQPPVSAARLRLVRSAPLAITAQADEPAREDWEDRLDELIEAWQDISAAQRGELAAQIRTLVDAGDRSGVARLTASSTHAAEVLEAVLNEQAIAAGERMVQAADDQGVSVAALVVGAALLALLSGTASAVAALLAAGLAVAAGREALRVWAPGDSGDEVAERVVEHLESLSEATLRTELGGAIWSAEGAGRFETLQQAEDDGRGATYYEASEIRDRNTCKPCAEIDGERFYTLTEARSHYPNGGYFTCLGNIRCRGTVEPFWSEA